MSRFYRPLELLANPVRVRSFNGKRIALFVVVAFVTVTLWGSNSVSRMPRHFCDFDISVFVCVFCVL